MGLHHCYRAVFRAWRNLAPALLPAGFKVHDVSPLGTAIGRVLVPLQQRRSVTGALLLLGLSAAAVIAWRSHAGALWNRELAALSPISAADLDYDAALRTDLGAADVREVLIVSGRSLEDSLQSAELAAAALAPLIDARVIASYQSPATYLPSNATQERRRSSLPAPARLSENLKEALKSSAGTLPVKFERLQPFLEDVDTTRHAALMTARELHGTSLGAAFDSLMLHQRDQWNALIPLRAASTGADIDLRRIRAALADAHLPQARVLDLKGESDDLYAQYLTKARRLSLAGLLAITLLLAVVLRSPARVARVLAPLILSVLVVTAVLALCRVQLTILHLVGLLLIIAVGSNYALFFDRQTAVHEADGAPRTLASLAIANASTVIGFGLLSFSGVPVLAALGTTVAPGAFLALLFAALLARRV